MPAWTRQAWPHRGGAYAGPNPTDRGKLGSKRHLIADRDGAPLAFCVTGANRHDSVAFEELVDALPPITGKAGRPRRLPVKVHADKAYDIDRCRDHFKQRGITPASLARGSSATIGLDGIAG
ncbi:IS5 family transposase [Pseudoxanthomonas sp. SORGH_AS 997]|uniref:IS5 family transposase n=1 Tax=Pseudoxanthomonas winnipegensis TaxID=2480810 RepID=A0AAW8GER2_9GAMM|nr:IS5 family transposase [Pseudoxanthomonas winnipegensis]MDQ1133911.1 IS5 family transposase [Pseudoxanthomonas winnipegensis]MDR6139853.1 IS5 family transposase [Pseudoxanthomonas sp. SORGH_AS_0997]